LARAVASQLDANFLKVVSSAIVDKYIGESARLIREMFGKSTRNNSLQGLQWTLSAMTSQHKNGGDSRGTLYRVVLGEMAFSYDNIYMLQQGGR